MSLAVKNMIRNRRRSRSIADAGWSQFIALARAVLPE
jgi:transposase